MDFHRRASASQNQVTATAESSESVLESPVTSTSGSTKKLLKVPPSDTGKILVMFENLNTDKCRKLSTGTIVEKKMKDYAIECNYEQ